MVRIGDIAPDFTAQSTTGEIKFHDFIGDGYVCLFSHPKDFTPVCSTELGAVSKLQPEFAKRNCKIIGLSVDSLDDHNKWIGDINEISNTELKYPLLDDSSRSIAKLYDMLDQENDDESTGLPLTVRSLFLIGPDKKVKVIFTYPASCGRNFNEVLRALDSVQLTANKSIVTPANWKEGDDVIIAPNVSNDDAKAKYGEFNTVKPYLRYVKASQVPK